MQERVRASHILFSVPEQHAEKQKNEIRKFAESVLIKIKQGKPFEEMIAELSGKTDQITGGDLGWFRRGDMVAEFEKVAFATSPGEVSPVIQTKYGYHIIKVTDRGKSKPPRLENKEKEIRNILHRERFQAAMKFWLNQLRRNSFIEIKI